MSQSHTVKSFDEELGKLNDGVARMGGVAEAQLAAAIDALGARNSNLAGKVLANDAAVDAGEQFVNDQTLKVLALRAPVADDLRTVLCAMKVSGEIERVADLAANAAKRSLVLNRLPPVAPMGSLLRLGRAAHGLLKEALDAYLNLDAARSLRLRDRDQELDETYSSLFREILTYMMEDPRTITPCTHLMFIAKNLERIGDHATNIAELTYFRVKGEAVAGTRPKRDSSSFEGAGGEQA